MKASVVGILAVGFVVFTVPAVAEQKQQNEQVPAVDETEEVIFERLTGWYVEGRGGLMFTVAGARGYSNAQPYLGFDIGYDVTPRLSVQFGYATGFQSSNPLQYQDPAVKCAGDNGGYNCDFSMSFFDIAADYDLLYGQRWAFEARLGGGVVVIDPSAKPDQPPVDGNIIGGFRFEYYTLLKHFTLAIELDFLYTFVTAIPALSTSVGIAYTF